MSPSTIIEDDGNTESLESIAISTAMGICRLDIPVARRDFTATLAAPLPDYADPGCVV